MGIGSTVGRGGAFAAAILLSACGGDGDSNAVALKTEADVARELTNVYSLYFSSVDNGAGPARAGVGRMLQQAYLRPARAEGTRAKAETFQCDSGSYDHEYNSATARELALFGVSPTVDWYFYDNRDCRYVVETSSDTTDGYEEYGFTASSGGSTSTYRASASPEAPAYDYLVQGRNGGWLSYVSVDPDFDQTFTIRSKGRGEYRDDGSSVESREVLAFTYALRVEDFRDEISLSAGESGNPLVIVDNYAGNTFTVDGPFSYHYESFCVGGRLVYDTVQPLAVSSDNGTYLSGGQLTISSGGATVSLTFQADGDVTYSIEGGATGEVTRAELEVTPGCPAFLVVPG